MSGLVQVYLPIETVKATFREVASIGTLQDSAYLWLTFSDISAIHNSNVQMLYGASQFVEYARKMGENAVSGIDPSTLANFVSELGFEVCDGVGGMPGHMTPAMKDAKYLKPGHFVRTSQVFHNALCKVVPKQGCQNKFFELISPEISPQKR